jgi:chromosome segregation ATPase
MLNAPEVPLQPQPSELEQLRGRLGRLEERADKLPAEKTERLIRHIDERFNEVREALARLEERIPTLMQLEARIVALEQDRQRLDGKLDDLWREHTKLVNGLQ